MSRATAAAAATQEIVVLDKDALLQAAYKHKRPDPVMHERDFMVPASEHLPNGGRFHAVTFVDPQTGAEELLDLFEMGSRETMAADQAATTGGGKTLGDLIGDKGKGKVKPKEPINESLVGALLVVTLPDGKKFGIRSKNYLFTLGLLERFIVEPKMSVEQWAAIFHKFGSGLYTEISVWLGCLHGFDAKVIQKESDTAAKK